MAEKSKTEFNLTDALKQINVNAAARKLKRDTERAAATAERRKRMSSKPMPRGSSIKGLQGLQGSLGSKITK